MTLFDRVFNGNDYNYERTVKAIDEAIAKYGALKGGRLAAWRLMRCHPWSKGGYDPVPEDPGITMKKE